MCRFTRSMDEIARLLATVTAFCREHGATAQETFGCELAAEELFTNFVKYNQDGTEPIQLDLRMTDGALIMTFADHGVAPFDLAQAPEVDVTAPAEQRRPGGLGLYLVRAYMDRLEYEYTDRTLRVTATKKLEAGDVRDPLG